MQQKKSHLLRNIIIVFVVLAAIGAAMGGGKDKKKSDSPTAANTAAAGSQTEAENTTEAVEETTQISYEAHSVNEMMQDLRTNAMNASDKYKDKNLEITGKLSTIDSSGKYISLIADGEFEVVGVTCYIKSDEQKEVVKTKSSKDMITLRGKCTDVGEVLGYSLDIDSID